MPFDLRELGVARGHDQHILTAFPGIQAQGHKYEALLDLEKLHDFEVHAMRRRLLELVAGVALVDKSDFDRVTGDRLYRFSQLLHLSPILRIRRRHMQSQQMPQVSTAICTLLPRVRCAPSSPARRPLSSVDRRVRLSKMASEGSP